LVAAVGFPSLRSEFGANIEVLHDCEHTSVLRFNTPSPGSKLINVREPDEQGPLPPNPASATPRDDGGGIGKQPIC